MKLIVLYAILLVLCVASVGTILFISNLYPDDKILGVARLVVFPGILVCGIIIYLLIEEIEKLK